jgi:environmental stress-induced protein Ves
LAISTGASASPRSRATDPFSRFPGIDRKLAVLEGQVALTVERRAQVILDPASQAVDFPGEAAVESRLTGGPSLDLNVMTRRGRYASQIAKQSATQLAATAPMSLIVALNDLMVTVAGSAFRLERLDALLIDGPASPNVTPKGAVYYLIGITPSRS